MKIKTIYIILLVLLKTLFATSGKPQYNVLMLASDDMRPDIGAYGSTQVITPNLDQLAAEGLLFERAYCQMAICMASRASLMSGYRPNEGELWKNGPLFKHIPDALSINQHFYNNGFETVGMGKLYHYGTDKIKGWSKGYYSPRDVWPGRGYAMPNSFALVEQFNSKQAKNIRPNTKSIRLGLGPAYEAADHPQDPYFDGLVAQRAIQELKRLKTINKPFFMGVGFIKPHLPFNAPQKYWDLYDPQKLVLPDAETAPLNSSELGHTWWAELRGYVGIPKKGPISERDARTLTHGYYACISYIDNYIGMILDELKRLELDKNTIVVYWSDHGFKLGEYGMWCKHTNFEIDTRVPLIIRVPGMKNKGSTTKALSELVDIYPTLCELAGIEKPQHLQGHSLAPIIDGTRGDVKGAAFSQFPANNDLRKNIMGYSMRTHQYRYTEWVHLDTHEIKARELYDHSQSSLEMINIYEQNKDKDFTKTLSKKLRRHFLF